MRTAASIACSIVLAACGGGDAELELLPGSPAATRALAFAADGSPVAIGGPSTFGLAQLQVHADGAWTVVPGAAGFDARAQLLGGGALPLSALSQSTTLYRAGEPVRAAWTAYAIPAGATPGTLFGTDATGRIYGLDLADGDGNGAVVSWLPGNARWDEVPGTRPVEAGVRELVVEGSGRVSWIAPGIGVVRVEAGARSVVVDCAACAFHTPTYDAAGALTVVACPTIVRVRADGGVVELGAPDGHVACASLDTAPDGTTLLASFGDTGDGALSILGPRAAGWDRIAAARPGLTYLIRDQATAYAHGDGAGAHGVHVIAF